MKHEMMMLVIQLGIIVVASRFFGWFFVHILKQPQVLGELISGMVIGPYLLGRIVVDAFDGPIFPLHPGTIPVSPELYGLAVLGSVILLFLSGLETDLPTFIRFSGKGTIVGLGGIVLSFLLGSGLTVLFAPGIDSILHPEALFLGTISTATSVGITARILSERKKLSTPEGVTILAAAVLDDVLSIVLLSVVIGMAAVYGTSSGGVNWGHIGVVALKAVGFWLICTVIGILVAPLITKRMKFFQSIDLIAGIAFGIALILAGLSELFELAMIIGAYITGLAFSQTDVSHEIRERIQGIYEYLVPVFFCVMGMMVDFQAIAQVFWFGLAFTLTSFVGKIIGCGLPALFAGFNLKGAYRIGVGMLPRGEVTLIVAGIGLASGAIGTDMFGVAIMTMLFASIAAPPMLIHGFKDNTSGFRKKIEETAEEVITIELDLPSIRAAEFMRKTLAEGFRNEGFFIQSPDHNQPVYQVRQEHITFTLMQNESRIIINTPPEHEPFVRMMLMEALLDFKEFLSALESMKSPDMMGAELMMGIFAQSSPKGSQ